MPSQHDKQRDRGSGVRSTSAPRPEPAPDGARKSPGHVVFDGRGMPIWEWAEAEGDSTSILLKRLDNDALQLEPTRPVPTLGGGRGRRVPPRSPGAATDRSPGAAPTADKSARSTKADEPRGLALDDSHRLALDEPGSGGGFDPYNRS